MNNAAQWIEGNLALLLGAITFLLIINLLVMFILTSRVADIMRETKRLGFSSNSLRHMGGNGLNQTANIHAQQISASNSADHSLPDSLLIEKAIAMIHAGTPLERIQSDLGIDGHYLEILVKQHKT